MSVAEPIQYRVNPKDAEWARAEVKVNGEWKLIDRYGFERREAIVFCRGAGYDGGESYSYSSVR